MSARAALWIGLGLAAVAGVVCLVAHLVVAGFDGPLVATYQRVGYTPPASTSVEAQADEVCADIRVRGVEYAADRFARKWHTTMALAGEITRAVDPRWWC